MEIYNPTIISVELRLDPNNYKEKPLRMLYDCFIGSENAKINIPQELLKKFKKQFKFEGKNIVFPLNYSYIILLG